MIRAGLHMDKARQAKKAAGNIEEKLQGCRKGQSYTLGCTSMGRREPKHTNFSVQGRQHGLSRLPEEQKVNNNAAAANLGRFVVVVVRNNNNRA